MICKKVGIQDVKKNIRRAMQTGWGILLALFFIPMVTVAQTPCPDGKLCNPINFPNLTAFLLEIVNIAIQYGALLIVFFIVFAGFKFVTAQGNSEKVSEARKMLTWIVVGAFVLLGVYVIKAAICGTVEQLGVRNACGLTTP